jgi:hypothetical protein
MGSTASHYESMRIIAAALASTSRIQLLLQPAR